MAAAKITSLFCAVCLTFGACQKKSDSIAPDFGEADTIDLDGASAEFSETEMALIEKEAQEEYEAEKKADKDELYRLIRVYQRAKRQFQASEARYYERLYMWCTAVVALATSNVAFAGEVPSRDAYTFEAYASASEDLLSGLDGYLDAYSDASPGQAADGAILILPSGDTPTFSVADYQRTPEDMDKLRRLRAQVLADVWEENPSCGLAIEDAITAFDSKHFSIISDGSRGGELLTKAGVIGLRIGIKNVIPGATSMWDQLGKEFNNVLNPDTAKGTSPAPVNR
jgi:hypothetical protein